MSNSNTPYNIKAPDGMEWLDDPATVDPNEWLQRMAESDPKPGDAMKRARSKLRYFLKTHPEFLAPPPFSTGHVFTDRFFRWLLKKYPSIQGIHPHYGRIQISHSVRVRWGNLKEPEPAPDPLTVLRKENEQLKVKIATLEGKVLELQEKLHRRQLINRANASRPRKLK